VEAYFQGGQAVQGRKAHGWNRNNDYWKSDFPKKHDAGVGEPGKLNADAVLTCAEATDQNFC
jgi:hypothetical protein